MESLSDDAIRAAALERVEELENTWRGAIPWSEIEAGFFLNGERVYLSGRAPRDFPATADESWRPLHKDDSTQSGRTRRYDDIASDAGYFEYRFMGNDPNSPDNRALREAWEDQSAFIYFHGVAPTLYEALFPAFITEWLPATLAVHVAVADIREKQRNSLSHSARQTCGVIKSFKRSSACIRRSTESDAGEESETTPEVARRVSATPK